MQTNCLNQVRALYKQPALCDLLRCSGMHPTSSNANALSAKPMGHVFITSLTYPAMLAATSQRRKRQEWVYSGTNGKVLFITSKRAVRTMNNCQHSQRYASAGVGWYA